MLKKGQKLILIINLIGIFVFTLLFLSRQNYEFLIYIAVIIFFLLLILLTNEKVNYPNIVLWGLTVWAFLHMSGGGIYVRGKKLYELILIPLIGDPYYILKYDQFVHMVGFGIAALAMYYLLKSRLKKNNQWVAVSVVIIMAGLGVGALNEILEFIATVITPETGVGGYINTSLDLVFNLIGAILAMAFIIIKEKVSQKNH